MAVAARMITMVALAIALLGSATVADAAGPRPVDYVVSEQPGFLPEGIAIDARGTMIVGSDATGAIARGDVRGASAGCCFGGWTGRAGQDTGRAPGSGRHDLVGRS